MFSQSKPFWKFDENLSQSPYPERRDQIPNLVDRAILEALARARTRFRARPTRYVRIAESALRLAETDENLSAVDLRAAANQLRPELLGKGFSQDLVARAFSLVRVAAGRALGIRHYPVQLQGGGAMLDGCMVEMATGEGKTVTALLPAVTAALSGLPVHVVTVNDYLAERDAENMRTVYEALGLTLGLVLHDDEPEKRREAYACDVTYVTNKEICFDYLKDRVALRGGPNRGRAAFGGVFGNIGNTAPSSELLLRGLHFAIVDEVDSILVDEARTPLVLSAESPGLEAEESYRQALSIAKKLDEGAHYSIRPGEKRASLTKPGEAEVARICRDSTGLMRFRGARNSLTESAITALQLFEKDKHYIVADGKVQIVDEYSGRVMEDRKWEGGLHQMVELKEDCELTGDRRTIARITYQRFFGRYRRLCGMSGTVSEVSGEFYANFATPMVRIPANRPVLRRQLRTWFFAGSDQKWDFVVERVRQVALHGQRPVLVGTRSVEASETLSSRLEHAGIAHEVLNARQDQQEADIISRSGQTGVVTVATNMAGRGTDIILGDGVRQLGGLHVILTEFHDSRRIDRQLYGRSGRQGDPGTCEAIIALNDELFRTYTGNLARLAAGVPATTGGITAPVIANVLRWLAQAKAERTNARTRRLQMKLDKKRDESLAFTGPPE